MLLSKRPRLKRSSVNRVRPPSLPRPTIGTLPMASSTRPTFPRHSNPPRSLNQCRLVRSSITRVTCRRSLRRERKRRLWHRVRRRRGQGWASSWVKVRRIGWERWLWVWLQVLGSSEKRARRSKDDQTHVHVEGLNSHRDSSPRLSFVIHNSHAFYPLYHLFLLHTFLVHRSRDTRTDLGHETHIAIHYCSFLGILGSN